MSFWISRYENRATKPRQFTVLSPSTLSPNRVRLSLPIVNQKQTSFPLSYTGVRENKAHSCRNIPPNKRKILSSGLIHTIPLEGREDCNATNPKCHPELRSLKSTHTHTHAGFQLAIHVLRSPGQDGAVLLLSNVSGCTSFYETQKGAASGLVCNWA